MTIIVQNRLQRELEGKTFTRPVMSFALEERVQRDASAPNNRWKTKVKLSIFGRLR